MIHNPMSDDERRAYALDAMLQAANIAYYPDQSKPPYFQHLLTEELTDDQFAFGPVIAGLVYPDLAFSVLSFRFESDYIKGTDPLKTTIEYLGLAAEAELPQRTKDFEQSILDEHPELLQYTDKEIIQVCGELGIPYALLVYAENQRTEEEVPLLFHPPFVKSSDALKAIQYLAAQRLEELTR